MTHHEEEAQQASKAKGYADRASLMLGGHRVNLYERQDGSALITLRPKEAEETFTLWDSTKGIAMPEVTTEEVPAIG